MEHSKILLFLSTALMAAAGCGGAPPPTAKVSDAEAAIRSARELGADRVPAARLHVTLAQEQVDKAKKLMSDGDNDRADLLLQRARADAELSLAMAKEDTAKSDAQKSQEDLKALKEKLK